MQVSLISVLTCPNCSFSEALTMPIDACQFFHVCSNCGTRLKAKQGDCCVFCSYGSVPCLPMQMDSKVEGQTDDQAVIFTCDQ